MSIRLAIADAANNCARDGATVTLTLRSGKAIVGKVKPLASAGADTVMLDLSDGGWATAAVEEVAAVESRPRSHW